MATGALPLSIIDMADFKPGGQARFFTSFAESLMKHMRGVLYLVMEEAHEFAPKERSGVGDENMSVYYSKKLATAGRSKGIRLIACTQSVQQLHNRVLGSCDTVIAHRMTAPADQKPVIDWLKGNVPDKLGRSEIEQSLPKLKTGEGWMCSGELNRPQRLQFPRINTYDNSATPESDSATNKVVTATVDTEKLRHLIGNAVAEAEANDPKKLKARIVELERELRKPKELAVDIDSLKRAGDELYKLGVAAACDAVKDRMELIRGELAKTLNGLIHMHGLQIAGVPAGDYPNSRPVMNSPAATLRQETGSTRLHGQRTQTPRAEVMAGTPSVTEARPVTATAQLSPAARSILDVMHRSYPVSLSFDAAARRAGISKRSSAYRSYQKAIDGSGEVELLDGKYRSLPQFAASEPLPLGAAVEDWARKLPPSYGKMLLAIQDGCATKDEIADHAGVSRTSSGLSAGLRELTDLQLVVVDAGEYSLAEGLG